MRSSNGGGPSGPPRCKRCDRIDVKIWPDGLCSFCGITLQKRMNVAGLDLVYKSRYDQINPYRDTMRAIEYMAHSDKCKARLEPGDLQRWARQARETLPDRSFKIDPDNTESKENARVVSPSEQAAAREAEGVMKELWNNAVYERQVLKRKPVNEIQKQNYDTVDKWADNG